MFEILEKEKRSNHVGSDQEYAEFLRESGNTTKDFSIELYLRARFLPRFLQTCEKVRIRDLYIIFDNPNATLQVARTLTSSMPENSKTILGRLRKLEFTHSPSLVDQEFNIIGTLLHQTTRNLNRVRIDHFKVMENINEVGLNSFIKLKKLRLEHLEAENPYEETYTTFLRHLMTNTSVTFIKVERVFTRDNNKLLMLIDALKTSHVKKMVLWLCKKSHLEATDQLCQFLHLKRLQSLKVRRFDHRDNAIDLLQVLIAINLHASSLKELYLEEWDFSQEAVVNVINTYLSDLCWFSNNLLTLRVNRQTYEAFAWKLKIH